MGKITVALLLSALTTTAVKAETFFTTGQLMQNCATTLMLHDFGKWVHPDNKSEDTGRSGNCFGFIEAARQMTAVANMANGSEQPREACISV